MPVDEHTGPVLLYDGECGFCARSVQFLLARDASVSPVLRFAPLQGEFAAGVLAEHMRLAEIDSVVWVERGAGAASRVLVRSDAALAALRHLGGVWALLALLARVVPRGIRDFFYDAVARRRLLMVAPSCLLPTAEQRGRFVD